mgnify:CR=1 FL=1
MAIEKVSLRGVEIYPFSSVEEIINFADENKGILVAVNAEKILNANEVTRPIINNNIGYCDGSGAVLGVKQKGCENACKIAGCELWLHIIARFHSQKSFYLIGAKPQVIEEVVVKLKVEYPDINIVGYRDGYIKTDEERKAVIADVVEKKPDVVFVAMGSPKQEIFMSEMLKQHKAIYQGLGGSFDVYSGHQKRAPKWWIDHNMEFAYRLIKQPKRITRNFHFIKYAYWLVTKKL